LVSVVNSPKLVSVAISSANVTPSGRDGTTNRPRIFDSPDSNLAHDDDDEQDQQHDHQQAGKGVKADDHFASLRIFPVGAIMPP
jgi:hypothetical protein